MHRPFRCIFHTSPAPDGPGYLGSFEVIDSYGNAVERGGGQTVYPRMQMALDSAWEAGRLAAARLEQVTVV